MNHRLLMVSKMDPRNADEVARIFGDHDDSGLPRQVGVGARTLFNYQGLTFHLIESDEDITGNVVAVHRDNPDFKVLSRRLDSYLSPMVQHWQGVADSQATEFYHRSWTSG